MFNIVGSLTTNTIGCVNWNTHILLNIGHVCDIITSMRKEPFGVGSFVHIIKRGGRGLSIVKDNEDRDRFLLMLAHFNDVFMSESWYRDTVAHTGHRRFERPTHWPEKEPLVDVVAFCLLDNHFHLLLREIQQGGVSHFMHKLGMGMTNSFNVKYNQTGSIFQGSYRSKTIDDDVYLRYVTAYIQVKNCLEMYPAGYNNALRNFDTAYEWATKYTYCSLGDFLHKYCRNILSEDAISGLFSREEYKKFSRDFVYGRIGDNLRFLDVPK